MSDFQIDVKQALTDIREQVKDRFSQNEIALATARAINRTLSKGKTRVGREIRAKYKMKLADLNNMLEVGKASRRDLTGTIQGSARTLTIGRFVSNVEAWKSGTDTNLEAEIIKGANKLLMKKFFINPKNGLIMAKGAYIGGKFVYDKAGKVRPIKTVSPYAASINQGVQKQYAGAMQEWFTDRLMHELNYLASKRGIPGFEF